MKKALLRWLVAAGAAGALLGGAAYARDNDCWYCYPCGCGNDGGNMMCCDGVPC